MTSIKLSQINVKSVKFNGIVYKLNKSLSNAKAGDLIYLLSNTNYLDCSNETFYVITEVVSDRIHFIDDVSKNWIKKNNGSVKLYSKKEGK